MRNTVFVIACLFFFSLYGCPPGVVKPRPGPSHVPPGQMKKVSPAAPTVVVVAVPVLPPLVVFDEEPYIFHEGFHYFLDGEVWYYSDTKWGPKKKLPKSHYPKEVRFKGKGKGKGKGKARGRNR